MLFPENVIFVIIVFEMNIDIDIVCLLYIISPHNILYFE